MVGRQSLELVIWVQVPVSDFRDVAEFGTAPDLGSGDRWFESSHPDLLVVRSEPSKMGQRLVVGHLGL